jgi:hypothetical protein
VKFSFDQMKKILEDYKSKKKSVNLPKEDTDHFLLFLEKMLDGTKELSSFLETMDKHEKDPYTKACISGCVACRARRILQGDSSCEPKKTGPKSG